MELLEQPREKLVRYGVRSLSDAELLALLIRSGFQGKPVLDLAKDLLRKSKGLLGLTNFDYQNLIQIPGIKKAKACELLALSELSRRMALDQSLDVDIVHQPLHLINWLKKEMGGLDQEHFLVVFLNSKNHILGYQMLFRGGLDRSIVHPREIYKHALSYSAAKIIVVHNHPSGDTSPSDNDRQVTQILEEAGATMGIPLLDHIIISKSGYRSLRETLQKD